MKYATRIPIVYGVKKVAPNVIWSASFLKVSKKRVLGKEKTLVRKTTDIDHL